MSLVTVATNVIERVPMTDAVTSAAVSFLVGRTRRKLARGEGASEIDFAKLMSSRPIACTPRRSQRPALRIERGILCPGARSAEEILLLSLSEPD